MPDIDICNEAGFEFRNFVEVFTIMMNFALTHVRIAIQYRRSLHPEYALYLFS